HCIISTLHLDSLLSFLQIFVFFFFFYCYGAPRDLHSFPTRRSSDLRPVGRCACRCRPARACCTRRSGSSGTRQPLPHIPIGPAPDRKSTRLNSSHDQISYAVFCLKKKKNKKTQSYIIYDP